MYQVCTRGGWQLQPNDGQLRGVLLTQPKFGKEILLCLSSPTKLFECFTPRHEWVESLLQDISSNFQISGGRTLWVLVTYSNEMLKICNVKSPAFKLWGTWKRSLRVGGQPEVQQPQRWVDQKLTRYLKYILHRDVTDELPRSVFDI